MVRRSAALAATLLIGIGLASAEVAAEYRGPRTGDTTVAEILKRPKDDSVVLLRGVIAAKTGPKTYLFRDETGEIQVEIKDKLFATHSVDDKTKVEITGEVEKDFRKPVHIDVDSMRILAAPAN